MNLKNTVQISRQFLRSVRIDLDWGNEAAIRGYVCQGSARQAIETTCRHFNDQRQAAFTWTGPYGGGKSSLALTLASYLGGYSKLRAAAGKVIGPELSSFVCKSLDSPRVSEPWLVVRVVGRRSNPIADIVDAMHAAGLPRVGQRLGQNPDARRVISVLSTLAEARARSGVLLVIDELGKFLEYAASHDGDIHFFQELAEAAARCKGRFLVIGILHQAFERYASRLGRENRDEWAKIQGRFVDVPIIAGVDEVIDLTAQAIQTKVSHPHTARLAKMVATAIRRNRPGCPEDLDARLDRCWPLHPATAAILGPVSKRRFGQNERSTFGFLASAETQGFADFLATTAVETKTTYEPARYWDYLRSNLEPSILASPDGHRWAQGAEAVERCEARGSTLHVRLIKSIALVDMFRNGSGLVADQEVLEASVPEVSSGDVKGALDDLSRWSMAIYRKHLGAWAVYEGSDFDIDEAVSRTLSTTAGLDVARLSALAGLQPVSAKRHYQQTGSLRWFETELVAIDSLNAAVQRFSPSAGAAGKFIIAIPTDDESPRSAQTRCRDASKLAVTYPVAIGLPKNASTIRSLGRELIALEAIRNQRPEILGDGVARKEMHARIAAYSGKLEEELRVALRSARWYVAGESHEVDPDRGIYELASSLADTTFPSCPVIQSELVNREQLSSNSQAAVNALVHAMVQRSTEKALGFDGYPAERGLYETVLRVTGLHVESKQDYWTFVRPSKGKPSASFAPLWAAADLLLQEPESIVPLSEIFKVWERAPYGLRKGVRGILGLVYLLSNRDTLAAYMSDMYQPELNETFAREVLRDPTNVALRRVVRDEKFHHVLKAFQAAILSSLQEKVEAEPLIVGRALVKFALDLPPWVKRTSFLSERALELRKVLIAASDPHKLLFVDLPSILGTVDPSAIRANLHELLVELSRAYSDLLGTIETKLFAALGGSKDAIDRLRERVGTVQGVSGDLRLDAFASRLAEYDGSHAGFEGLLSLAINKPTRDWTDLDTDAALLALAELALRFRHAEMLSAIKGRIPTRHALGVVFGTAEHGKTVMRAVDVGLEERSEVIALTGKILELIDTGRRDSRLSLAAIAEAGSLLLERADIDHG